MLGYFLRLAPPRFSRAIGEDTYEFLMSRRERLHTLRLLGYQGANCIAYQLDGSAM